MQLNFDLHVYGAYNYVHACMMAVSFEVSFVLDLLITEVGPIFEHIIPHWPVISVQLRRIDFKVLPSTSRSICNSIDQQKLCCGFIQHDPLLDSSTLPIRISCPTTSKSFFIMNAEDVSLIL